MAKSGSVSRQCPRSSPTTLSPASASSFAMIVPVRPTPTVTTSTGFNLVAIFCLLIVIPAKAGIQGFSEVTGSPFSRGRRQKLLVVFAQHHVDRVAVLVDLCDSLVDVGDGDRLRAVGDVVLVDEDGVYSGDAGEADPLG